MFARPPAEPFPMPWGNTPGPVITYAGTLGAINGVEYLVRIAALMLTAYPDMRFLIAGDGAARDRVSELASELGVLRKNLWIIAPIPKRQMPALLAATTVATSLFVN